PLEGHTAGPSCGAWSHDGAVLATGGDHTVRLWDGHTGKALHALPGHAGRICLAWSPDDRTLATAGEEDASVRLWDAGSGQVVRTFRAEDMGPVRCLAWSPDGKALASTGADDKVRLWDAKTAACTESFDLSHRGHFLLWRPDGGTLAALDDSSKVRLW